MATYDVNPVDFVAIQIEQFKTASVTNGLNGPNLASFECDDKFDATSVIDLQGKVALTYAGSTLFTGKVKEETRQLSAGNENISYRAEGANLDEAYIDQITEIIDYITGNALLVGGGANFNGIDINTDSIVTFYDEVYFGWGVIPGLSNFTSQYMLFNKDIYLKNLVGTSDLIYYAGNVDIGENVSFSPVLNNWTRILPIAENFPSIDFAWYYDHADPADRYTATFPPGFVMLYGTYTPKNGIIYVDGDVWIGGSSRIYGCVVATGNMYIEGVGEAEWSKIYQTRVGVLPAFICGGDFTTNISIEAHGLIYCGATMSLAIWPTFARTYSIRGGILVRDDLHVDEPPTLGNHILTVNFENYSDVPGLTF